MPIVEADIEFRLSGGADNTDPNASLGGIMSNTEISGTPLHNLFDLVTGDESNAGDTEYRGFYVTNQHATLTLQGAKIWLSAEEAGGASIEIALADEGVGVAMETIADESTAPVGPTFSAPTSKATGLSIGDIPALSYMGIWIKRVVPAETPAMANDGVTPRVEGDTAA